MGQGKSKPARAAPLSSFARPKSGGSSGGGGKKGGGLLSRFKKKKGHRRRASTPISVHTSRKGSLGGGGGGGGGGKDAGKNLQVGTPPAAFGGRGGGGGGGGDGSEAGGSEPGDGGMIHPFDQPLENLRKENRPLDILRKITHFDLTTLRHLQLIFREISASVADDGVIDIEEMTQAMGLDPSSLLSKTIFKVFDVTRTRAVNFRTWVMTLSALSPKASIQEKAKLSFSMYDLNDDGAIDVSELKQLLLAATRENLEVIGAMSEEDIVAVCQQTLEDVDVDGNGTVEFDEYKRMVCSSKSFVESFTLPVEDICRTFIARRDSRLGRNSRIGSKEALLAGAEFQKRAKDIIHIRGARAASERSNSDILDDDDTPQAANAAGSVDDTEDATSSVNEAGSVEASEGPGSVKSGPAAVAAAARDFDAAGLERIQQHRPGKLVVDDDDEGPRVRRTSFNGEVVMVLEQEGDLDKLVESLTPHPSKKSKSMFTA